MCQCALDDVGIPYFRSLCGITCSSITELDYFWFYILDPDSVVLAFWSKEIIPLYLVLIIKEVLNKYNLRACFPCGSAGKESACNAGGLGLVPGLGRSSGEGKGYPLQYSGLENSMDSIVHGVAKSWTRLNDFHFTFHFQMKRMFFFHQSISRFCMLIDAWKTIVEWIQEWPGG